MAHRHPVYDTDTHFSINPITRELKNEGSAKVSVIQFDHNSERFTFDIPRMIEDHDMSLCNMVQVHYLNIDTQTKATNAGVYTVDDMMISPEDNDLIILSWLISQNATQLVGSLNFLIRFMCVNDDGTVDYIWNTAIYTKISVSSGIYNGAAIEKEYPDILAEWEARLELNSEPAGGDIPKVFIEGTIPTAKTDVLAKMHYISKTEDFSAYLKIKCQGSSSLSYPKKNFTVKLYSDETRTTPLQKTFRDWRHGSNKFVLKANYIDHSHARNIVCANLWDEVVSSRPDYATLPTEIRSSPRNGAIDGFPIKVYTNGTYQGLYTWNIGKDAWMWGMDEDNPDHVLICGESNTDGTYAETACNFHALWSGTDGNDWSVEVGTNSETVKNSVNALITCVKDTDDDTFKATIGNYLDVQSAIDYYLHQYVICGLDGMAKNMLLATYNGTKWICGAYDMDSTFGLWWTGASFVSTDYRCPEDYQEKYSLLWERIATVFAEEVTARYAELRESVYSFANMTARFERFTDIINGELYAEDLEIYPDIPSGSTNNIKQIRNYMRDRLHYCDVQFGLITETPEIDYTLNALADVEWIDNYKYTYDTGELTNVANERCTEKFTLQDCVYTVDYLSAGEHCAVYVWDENGAFMGRTETQNGPIVLTADSRCSYALKIFKTGTFQPELITLMPVDNRGTMCNTVSLPLAGLDWKAHASYGVEADLGNVLVGGSGESQTVLTQINSVSGGVLKLGTVMLPWQDAYITPTFLGSIVSFGAQAYLSTKMFGQDAAAAKAYFAEHDTTIVINP